MMQAPTNKRWLSLQSKADPRGSLAVAEVGKEIPFDIRRVYYLFDVPIGQRRGEHAHKALHQVFIAIHGQFDLHLDDGHERQTLTLNDPARAFYLPPGYWRVLDNFSPGAVCLVLASQPYDAEDYLQSYGAFRAFKGLT